MANACPICAGIGGASTSGAATAAKSFDDLIGKLGGASSAATNLDGVLQKLAASEQAAATAAGIAAKTGYKAGDVRRAMAAQAKEAADAAKAAEKLAAKAAKAGDATKATGTEAADAAEKTAALSDALGKQATSATQASGSVGSLQKVLGMLGPEGQAAAVAIGLFALVAAAVVGVIAKVVSTAIEASQAVTQLQTSFGAYFGTGVAGGAKFSAELDKIAAKLPYTTAKIRDMAKPLIDARLRGAQLARAIEAVAAATAMAGESGGAAATNLIKSLAAGARLNQAVWISPDVIEQFAAAGIGAEVLARELGITEKRLQLSTVKASVLGDVLQRVLIKQGAGSLALVGQSLSSMWSKVEEGFTSAFSGMGDIIAPFMKELQSLASEFFKGSTAAKATGGVLRAVLEPAFKFATKAVRELHIGLLYLEIAALTAYISLRPTIAAVERLGVVGTLLKAVLITMGIVAAVVAVLVTGLAIAMFLVALPFIIAAVAIGLVIYALYRIASAIVGAAGTVAAGARSIGASIVGALQTAAEALATFPLQAAKAGLAFVAGLVQALFTGQGPVADAVKGLASSAVTALFGALKIRSPSRVAAQAGGYFVQGFTGEVDAGQEDASSAGKGLGNAAAGGLTSASKGGKGGAMGRAINFINCTFGAGMSEAIVRDMVSRILEAEAAAGPEPEGAT